MLVRCFFFVVNCCWCISFSSFVRKTCKICLCVGWSLSLSVFLFLHRVSLSVCSLTIVCLYSESTKATRAGPQENKAEHLTIEIFNTDLYFTRRFWFFFLFSLFIFLRNEMYQFTSSKQNCFASKQKMKRKNSQIHWKWYEFTFATELRKMKKISLGNWSI